MRFARTSILVVAIGVLGCTAKQPAETPAPRRFATPKESAANETPVEDDGPEPAGLCGFEPYLGTPCGDREAAKVALVVRAQKRAALDASEKSLLGDMAVPRSGDDVARAQELLARAKTLDLAPGYPFALDGHQLPSRNERRGVAVVAGLFRSQAHAKSWLLAHPDVASQTEIVELADVGEYERRRNPADGDYTKFLATRRVVVEVVDETPAWDDATVEKQFQREDHNREKMTAALAKVAPKCTVPAGALSMTNMEEVYKMNREYAPVMCGRTRAWVPWTATRLESVVTRTKSGPVMHQIVEVSCDSPSIASRPFGTRAKTLLAFGTCRG